MTYILGLDCGIKSVGASVVPIDDEERPVGIEAILVHLFEGGEQPKNGKSLAEPRRLSRSCRRLVKRKTQRLKQLSALMSAHGMSTDRTTPSYLKKCPWQARHDGLHQRLTHEEFVKALLHIAKRRGFKSNRKAPEPTDTDGKKALAGCQSFETTLRQSVFETVGDYLFTLDKKRNTAGTYTRTVKRELLQEEVKLLCQRQFQFGNKRATPAFEEAFSTIAFYQRPLASSEGLVGYCTFEDNEKRAPKKSYAAEQFLVYSDLVHLRILNRGSGSEKKLTKEQIQLLAEEAHKKIQVTFAQTRKLLSLKPEEYFKSKQFQYKAPKGKKITDWIELTKLCEKNKFISMEGYHTLRKTVEKIDPNAWKTLSHQPSKLDEIARILSFYHDENKILDLMAPLELEFEIKKEILKITNFSKTINLSSKAINKLLPFMKSGSSYQESIKKANYIDKKKSKNQYLLPVLKSEDLTTNPVVNRTITQARKVINAIISRYGSPAYVHIELARDLAKSRADRKKLQDRQENNEKEKKQSFEYAEQFFGENPSGEDQKKLRLWKQQKGFCIYSGKKIDDHHLKDRTATQIDHILPRSRSYDNSYHNQVLCFSGMNQEKGAKTPFEAWGGRGSWDSIVARAKELPAPKAQRILMEKFDARSQDWKDRSLNDTRYACRQLKNFIEENLALTGKKAKKVKTFNGALTSYARHLWGFPKNRDLDDTHHGLDAVIVACFTDRVVQQVHCWNRYQGRSIVGPQLTLPWQNFRHDLKEKISSLFISRAPNRKAKGSCHDATIRAIRSNKGNKVVTQKTPLSKIDLKALETMYDKERNWRLYNHLKMKLVESNDKPNVAFKDPVFMPTIKKSVKQNQVNSIRVTTTHKNGVLVRGGFAEHSRMVRVDIFKSEKGFHLCPIYIDDVAKGILPNNVLVPGKDPVDLDDTYQFLFSLYKNDLIEMITKKNQSYLGYYQGTDISTGSVKIMHHHSSQSTDKRGVKSMKEIKKYSVNYFGERFEVKGEKRLGVEKYLHKGKIISQNFEEQPPYTE